MVAEAKPQPPTRLLRVVGFSIFVMSLGFMGGYESALSLIVNQWYGWEGIETGYVWFPFAVNTIILNLFIIPAMFKRMSDASIAITALVVQLGMLAGINWSDFSSPQPAWVFIASKMFTAGYGISYMHQLAILSKRVPKEFQVQYNTMVQLGGQVRRIGNNLICVAGSARASTNYPMPRPPTHVTAAAAPVTAC